MFLLSIFCSVIVPASLFSHCGFVSGSLCKIVLWVDGIRDFLPACWLFSTIYFFFRLSDICAKYQFFCTFPTLLSTEIWLFFQSMPPSLDGSCDLCASLVFVGSAYWVQALEIVPTNTERTIEPNPRTPNDLYMTWSPRILLLFSNLMTLSLILVFLYYFLLELNKHTHRDNTVLLKKSTCYSSVFFI